MCRSIKTLRGQEPATDDDIHAAALQFVRKVSGYRAPSKKNAEAFERAVEEIAASSRRMLEELTTPDAREAAATPRRSAGRRPGSRT